VAEPSAGPSVSHASVSYRGAVAKIVRPATPADIPAIAQIYGYAVRDSVATFDVTDPPPSYWQKKLASAEVGDHVVVVEDAATVLGYAYSTAFRPRPAYAHTRETSIYLAPEAVGHGVGRLAYAFLISLLRDDRMHCAVAVVAEPNPASIALHESLGFELVGILREVGRKFDRWIDTRWYQLRLEP
jgi:L-amino acid N-acyltransferase YncA